MPRFCARVVVMFGLLGGLLGGLLATLGCDTEAGGGCVCTPCTGAVTLFVVDNAAQPATDWSAVATLDGVPVDMTACDVNVRAGSNQCTFGDELGVYQVTVNGPTGQVQSTARLASRVGQNCCTCLSSTLQQVALP